jgi:hypothetical protein
VFSLNCDELPAPLAERFKLLFQVAGRKSVVAWSLSPVADADMQVVDRARVDAVQPTSTCVVTLALDDAQAVTDEGTWVKPHMRHYALRANFTVAQLLDVLDLAGVWLLQQRAASGAQLLSPQGTTATFRLKRWVVPSGALRGVRYATAMAALSRQPLTVNALTRHTGLRTSDVETLIAHLSRQGALHIVHQHTPDEAAAEPTAKSGLVAKVSQWLRSRRLSLIGGQA